MTESFAPPPPPTETVALLPWGNVIEEFLDSIGVSLEGFCREFTGSWMFRYVAALERAGVRTVIICVSARVVRPTRCTHLPSGATIHLLPASRLHRALRSGMRMPFGPEGTTVRQAYGPRRGLARALFPLRLAAKELVLYAATPVEPLRRVLREERCRAILCQEYEYPRFDLCVALGRAMRLPVFGTFQGGDYQRNHLEPLIRPLALRAAAGLIVAPEREARRVAERYRVPPSRIARIYNPIDLRLWHAADRAAARANLGIAPGTAVAVWHGRVSIGPKGLDLLLAAWSRVRRERPGRDLLLLLVGSGPDAARLAEMLGPAGSPGIRWVREFIHDPDAIRRHLAAADVYAFPSRHEGFPVAPLEAMATGLPVVAADAPGMSDILMGGEAAGGVLVPRDDGDAFAAALGALLDDPGRRAELGRRARARMEEAFSLETVGRQLRAFLLPERNDAGGVEAVSRR